MMWLVITGGSVEKTGKDTIPHSYDVSANIRSKVLLTVMCQLFDNEVCQNDLHFVLFPLPGFQLLFTVVRLDKSC